jgi:hypothetical protein
MEEHHTLGLRDLDGAMCWGSKDKFGIVEWSGGQMAGDETGKADEVGFNVRKHNWFRCLIT